MSWLRPKRPSQPPRAPDPLQVVRAYHQRTKHDFHRYAVGPPDLDWATQPDPFRRWVGAPSSALERPGQERGCEWSEAMAGAVPSHDLDAGAVSGFLYDSLALSAWKQAGEARWSLRVNPSSGNLHPTEAHLLLPAIHGLSDGPAVFHYAPREHELERRAVLDEDQWRALAQGRADVFFVGLTSIHWREAWKYGERAYRYCQHDVGHAIAALAVAAAGSGWRATVVDDLGSVPLGAWLGCECTRTPEEEAPDVLVRIEAEPGSSTPAPPRAGPPGEINWLGEPSDLSPDHVEWEVIEVVDQAVRKPASSAALEPHERLPKATDARRPFRDLRQVVRTRRSAVAMDGRTAMPREAFLQVLDDCLPRSGSPIFDALPWRPRMHLALFVNRVEGLASGLYWLARDAEAQVRARAAMSSEFLWQKPADVGEDLPLYLLNEGDVRGLAARLSCNQEIAGAGAFSLGMIADFDAALEEHGAWFYPRLYWEAGAIGQRLYLESEVQGLRGTGIGCFFDDPVHAALGLRDRSWQSLYHFTVGGPVDDPRLRTAEAYPEESP